MKRSKETGLYPPQGLTKRNGKESNIILREGNKQKLQILRSINNPPISYTQSFNS